MIPPTRSAVIAGVAVAALALAIAASQLPAAAQTNGGDASNTPAQPQPSSGNHAAEHVTNPTHSMAKGAQEENSLDQYTEGNAANLLKVPVSKLFPGGIGISPNMPNPVANDPAAANRGMRDFINLNCVGCHAPNGAGGMGPSLSDRVFIYGDKPGQIFLTIMQGRPHGMPAWGGRLPADVIWDLVAYIEGIHQPPHDEWGRTISPTSPKVEQVPAEFGYTTKPWQRTEPFGYGKSPQSRKQ